MNELTIKNMSCRMPEEYKQIESMPDDPQYSLAFAKTLPVSHSFFLVYPLEFREAIPLTNLDELNYGVHAFLSESQGVVELNNGKTADGRVYAYSIVKTAVQPSGVQYTLTLQIAFEDAVLNIQSSHSEIGITGQREAVILEAAIRQGIVTPDMNGWAYDPYIADYKDGLLFNLSEQAELDNHFPGHALSKARLLKNYIIENN